MHTHKNLFICVSTSTVKIKKVLDIYWNSLPDVNATFTQNSSQKEYKWRPDWSFRKEINNIVGKSKTNYAQGKSKSHTQKRQREREKERKRIPNLECERREWTQIYRVYLWYCSFHLNSIRLLLWNWHTPTRGIDGLQLFRFSQFSFHPFLFSLLSASASMTGWVLSKEWRKKNLSAPPKGTRERKFPTKSKAKKIFQVFWTCLYLFIFGYFIFKACDLIRLSLLFLYKLLGDAIHRHHNCNRNNMIISKSELALAPAAKINRTQTYINIYIPSILR